MFLFLQGKRVNYDNFVQPLKVHMSTDTCIMNFVILGLLLPVFCWRLLEEQWASGTFSIVWEDTEMSHKHVPLFPVNNWLLVSLHYSLTLDTFLSTGYLLCLRSSSTVTYNETAGFIYYLFTNYLGISGVYCDGEMLVSSIQWSMNK